MCCRNGQRASRSDRGPFARLSSPTDPRLDRLKPCARFCWTSVVATSRRSGVGGSCGDEQGAHCADGTLVAMPEGTRTSARYGARGNARGLRRFQPPTATDTCPQPRRLAQPTVAVAPFRDRRLATIPVRCGQLTFAATRRFRGVAAYVAPGCVRGWEGEPRCHELRRGACHCAARAVGAPP